MEIARQTEPFDPSDYEDPEEAEFERRRELSESARDLLVVERVREWLLEECPVCRGFRSPLPPIFRSAIHNPRAFP